MWARCSVVVVRGATKSRPAPGRATPQRARPSSGEVVERWMPGRGRDWPQAVGWHRSGSASAVPFCRREAVAVRGGRSATRPCRTTLRTSVQRRAWLALRFVRATMSECQCVRPEACTNPQWMWRLISFGSSSMAKCHDATVVRGGREVPCRVGRIGSGGVGVGGSRRVRPRC